MSKQNVEITMEQLADALNRSEFGTDNPGFCLACGEEQEGCEPDARNYLCESCGKHRVFGAQEILLMGAFKRT